MAARSKLLTRQVFGLELASNGAEAWQYYSSQLLIIFPTSKSIDAQIDDAAIDSDLGDRRLSLPLQKLFDPAAFFPCGPRRLSRAPVAGTAARHGHRCAVLIDGLILGFPLKTLVQRAHQWLVQLASV